MNQFNKTTKTRLSIKGPNVFKVLNIITADLAFQPLWNIKEINLVQDLVVFFIKYEEVKQS